MRGETRQVHFDAGCHIDDAAGQLVAVAQETGQPAFGMFNGIRLEATATTSRQDVVRQFETESDARAKVYRESPEGMAAEREREEDRKEAQAQHDALMRKLPRLDFTNDAAVLDWCCAMQAPSDHVGVTVQRDKIVQTFERHSFVAGANCGPDYRKGNRDNEFRYLVGQALSGLKDGPAIHPIIHKFADEWRSQYAALAKATEGRT